MTTSKALLIYFGAALCGLTTAGCGSGFVKGWNGGQRDNEFNGKTPSQCAEGYTLSDGTCQKNEDLGLTPDQCSEQPGKSWHDGRCYSEAEWACRGDAAKTWVPTGTGGDCLAKPT